MTLNPHVDYPAPPTTSCGIPPAALGRTANPSTTSDDALTNSVLLRACPMRSQRTKLCFHWWGVSLFCGVASRFVHVVPCSESFGVGLTHPCGIECGAHHSTMDCTSTRSMADGMMWFRMLLVGVVSAAPSHARCVPVCTRRSGSQASGNGQA